MKHYDVIIVGRGLTGLSTAWHLKRLGIRRIVLIAPKRMTSNCGSLLATMATTTLHDNISRPVHNLGADITRTLLATTRHGFSQLADLLDCWNLSHAVGQVRRIALTDHETEEMEIATTWLESHGFPARHTKRPSKYHGCKSLQLDGAASLSFNSKDLLNKMEQEIKVDSISSTVTSMTTQSSGLLVQTACGERYQGEIVVAACHEGIRKLIPDLSESLVNHADQSVEFELLRGELPINPGDHVLAGHGHYWLTYHHQKRLTAGGCKFLRKWAGVEAEKATVMTEISQTLKNKWEEIFAIQLSEPKSSLGFLELCACDELPIIGPMYGDSRVLVASGFINSGVSLAMAAGQGLAEFITAGKSQTISPVFLPARMRSLPESL